MRRIPLYLVLLFAGFVLAGADGCSSDPNVEGAKLDLRNKDYDRALENINKALERDPQNAEAHYLKGQVIMEQTANITDPVQYEQRVQEMTAAFNQARTIDAALGGDIDQRMRLAYYNVFQKGVQAFNRGQSDKAAYGEAANYFRIAATVQPDSAGAYINQAYALMNAGQQAEAIVPFEKAMEMGDTQTESFVFLGNLYQAAGRHEDTVRLLERAREMYPDNPDIQAQLLNAYIAANQVDRAMQTYQDAVTKEPANKLYRYNYGSLLLEAKEYDRAIEQLGEAVKLDPEYANAHYNLGAAYVNKAVDLSERINAIDDDLRANRSKLSADQIKQREAEMEQLIQQRRSIFDQAVPPLERAKSLMEGAGENAQEVCRALFSAYVQTDQQTKAESISACAGYEDIK
jgi:tetratricopeptide (TPR) repeat protein